jgi:hypothetical protein
MLPAGWLAGVPACPLALSRSLSLSLHACALTVRPRSVASTYVSRRRESDSAEKEERSTKEMGLEKTEPLSEPSAVGIPVAAPLNVTLSWSTEHAPAANAGSLSMNWRRRPGLRPPV